MSISQKHAHFFATLTELPEPWGLGKRDVPELKFKGSWPSILNLKPFFGNGIHRAMLTYSFRREPSDVGLDDDRLNITFDANKVNTQHLLHSVIPNYIKGFDAYLVELFDEAMIELAATELQNLPVNPRRYVYRVGLVSFFDAQLCRRAFELSPSQVADRVKGFAERAELLHGGVYIVGASPPLPLTEIVAKCQQLITAVRSQSHE